MKIFPDLVYDDKATFEKAFSCLLNNNKHLENSLAAILKDYDYQDNNLKSYLASICFSLVDFEIALSEPFKTRLKENLSLLKVNFLVNKENIKAIDQKLNEVLELDWIFSNDSE